MDKRCLSCNTKLINVHKNRKRCEPCAALLRKRPKHNLTEEQIKKLHKLKGTIYYEELAKRIGASRSSVTRYARDHGISLNALSYKPDVIQNVCAYYEIHGKRKTQEKFPDVSVRSIVERYKEFKPRQIKWKDNEIIELIKMAGLVSPKSQAKYFNRPNANEGSIKSVFITKIKCPPTYINGLTHRTAKTLVNSKCRYIKPLGLGRNKKSVEFRRMALWVDIEKSLKKDLPNYLVDAVQACAEFQRWIHGGGDVKKKIKDMIRERENL